MCNIGCKNESRDGICRLPRIPKNCAMGRAEQESAKIRCYECEEIYGSMPYDDKIISNIHYWKCVKYKAMFLAQDTVYKIERQEI